ncbi:unnamed protein product [Effrenium voratum]|nr:unnamed protein product [Effrenium voratum]
MPHTSRKHRHFLGNVHLQFLLQSALDSIGLTSMSPTRVGLWPMSLLVPPLMMSSLKRGSRLAQDSQRLFPLLPVTPSHPSLGYLCSRSNRISTREIVIKGFDTLCESANEKHGAVLDGCLFAYGH